RDLEHLPEPAAILAGAAGALAQLLAPEDDRPDVLGRLDRHGMHAAREGRGAEAVERRACARAAAVEEQHLGALAAVGGRVLALERPGADVEVPQRAGALRR